VLKTFYAKTDEPNLHYRPEYPIKIEIFITVIQRNENFFHTMTKLEKFGLIHLFVSIVIIHYAVPVGVANHKAQLSVTILQPLFFQISPPNLEHSR